jgi:hypothetical protein
LWIAQATGEYAHNARKKRKRKRKRKKNTDTNKSARVSDDDKRKALKRDLRAFSREFFATS